MLQNSCIRTSPVAKCARAEGTRVSAIDGILAANRRFAANFEPRPAQAPHVAVVLCMDARIDPIRALGLPYGTANIIRTAGGRIADALRSLAISQSVLGTNEVAIVHHTECGLEAIDDDAIRERLAANGLSAPADMAFHTFRDLEQSLDEDMAVYRASTLVRQDIPVRTFVYEVGTGLLREVGQG